MRLLVSAGLIMMTLSALLFLIAGRLQARRARQAWLSGYWTGKSELQASLDAFLRQHQQDLVKRPDLLGPLLVTWIEHEDLSNRAMAQLQGMRAL